MSSVFNTSYIEAAVKNQCGVVKCPFGSSFASWTYELELSGRRRVNDIWGDVFMITINHVLLGLERSRKNCIGYALTGANKSFCSCQFEGVAMSKDTESQFVWWSWSCVLRLSCKFKAGKRYVHSEGYPVSSSTCCPVYVPDETKQLKKSKIKSIHVTRSQRVPIYLAAQFI